jgi:uncharacterized membrane protein YphA (DoxX/SURF4 family)
MSFFEDSTRASGKSLAMFRIVLGAFLMLLVLRIMPYRDIYFDQVKGTAPYTFPSKLLLFFWFISAFFLAIGFKTRISSIICYTFTVIGATFFSMTGIGSFNDDVLRISTLLLALLPSADYFSVDALLKKMSDPLHTASSQWRLNYRLAIILILGMLYAGSAISKLLSPVWQQGLGLWIPYSVPARRWLEFSPFINNKLLMQCFAWATIIWELAFPLLFFRRKFSLFFAISGIALHVFIGLVFPIYFFCMGPILAYSLFISDNFWSWLERKLKNNRQFTVTYNHEIRAQRYLAGFLISTDWSNTFQLKKGDSLALDGAVFATTQSALNELGRFNSAIWLIAALSRIRSIRNQLANVAILITPQVHRSEAQKTEVKQQVFVTTCLFIIGLQTAILAYGVYAMLNKSPEQRFAYHQSGVQKFDLSPNPVSAARIFFGINKRGLFLDASVSGSFKAVNLSLVNNGTETPLPLYDANGYCQSLNRDFGWSVFAHYYFLKDSYTINHEALKKFTSFWNIKNGLNPKAISYKVYTKVYTYPKAFEIDYLKKQEALQWDFTGTAEWQDSTFRYLPAVKDSVK